ncbi:hypothetical protein [Streptomyces violascens]
MQQPAAAARYSWVIRATEPGHQPGGTYWMVLLDLSGQPFCIDQTH